MNYTKDIEKAMIISYKAYEGEMDENGVPIFFHSMGLADAIWDEKTIIVALLNDLIENAGYSPEDFTEMGFSEAVIDALKLLEYDADTSYTEYIKKLAENPFSRAVKIEQLDEMIYNLQLSYTGTLKEEIIKYSDAKDYLMKCEVDYGDDRLDAIINKITPFPGNDIEECTCRFVINVLNEILERYTDMSFYQAQQAIRYWKLWEKTVTEPQLVNHYGVANAAKDIYIAYQERINKPEY